MIRQVVHNSSTQEDKDQEVPIAQNENNTKTDSYDEYLDHIDFLKHVDMSDYETEIFNVESDTIKEEEISVNVDYLDDLAFFDELDYFEQLNKSLEKELKDLDGKIHSSAVATKRRWVRKHSNLFMVTAGMGILLVLGGAVISAVGIHLSKTDVSYASTEYKPEENEESTMAKVNTTEKPKATTSAKIDSIPFIEMSSTERQQQTETQNVSQQMIPKREQTTPVTQAPKTPAPTATAKAKGAGKQVAKVNESDMESFFSDSVFLGNSLTEGLHIAGGVKSAKYLAATSLNVSDVFTRRFVRTSSGMKTAIEALKDIKCSKIYIMFGINEVGWPYPKVYEERYITMINKIKEIKPNAKIYIQSMLPVSKSLTNSDKEYKLSNMKRFNQAMENAAKKTKCIYVDVIDSVVGSDGYLPEDAAVDGMHMKREYNKKWISYLYNKTK